MKYLLETYGCQMNGAESAAMERALAECGWEKTGEGGAARLVILNTCAVRVTAEQRALGRLAHYAALKKKRPLRIIVCGCVAARAAGELIRLGADYVIGTEEKHRFTRVVRGLARALQKADAPLPAIRAEDAAAAGEDSACAELFAARHDEAGAPGAFVPVMHGCDNFCAYCVVPYTRGREVSRPVPAVLAEIRALAENGTGEITLLGQNVNAYRWRPPAGEDVDFAALVRLVARAIDGTPVRWARFLSAHPKDVSPALVEALAGSPRFCRHIHLPVQHGSDRVLALMNRRYTRDRYRALVRALRAALPGLTLSTDILVGFPGESEADVEDTLALMEDVRFDRAFMYHYNPREGTAAFGMPGRVDEATKRARLARIIALQHAHTKAALEAALGTERLVLALRPSRRDGGAFLCRSEHEEMCVVRAAGLFPGRFLRVRLEALAGNTFTASLLAEA